MPQRSNTSVITSGELKNIRKQIDDSKQNQSKISCVTQSELSRIKRNMVIETAEETA